MRTQVALGGHGKVRHCSHMHSVSSVGPAFAYHPAPAPDATDTGDQRGTGIRRMCHGSRADWLARRYRRPGCGPRVKTSSSLEEGRDHLVRQAANAGARCSGRALWPAAALAQGAGEEVVLIMSSRHARLFAMRGCEPGSRRSRPMRTAHSGA